MNDAYAPVGQEEGKRPDLITTLGIFSFINCGLFLVIYGSALLFMLGLKSVPEEEFMARMQEQGAQFSAMLPPEQSGLLEEVGTLLYHQGALLMGLYLLRTVLRLAGVLGMWRGRRNGFHLYGAAQVLGIFLPHLVLPFKFMGLFGPLLALGMVAAYGSQLKRMA